MQPSFFDHQDRLDLLERLGDPLPKLERTIQWEAFREVLHPVYKASDPCKGGCPPFDAVLMFKVLVLQQFYNLSDDQTEFQIRDRYSFCRFLGLSPEGRVPDAKTIWVFRERLKQLALTDRLFGQVLSQIDAAGFTARKGQIVDAALVPCRASATAGMKTPGSKPATRRRHGAKPSVVKRMCRHAGPRSMARATTATRIPVCRRPAQGDPPLRGHLGRGA